MSGPTIQYAGPTISPEVPWQIRHHIQLLYNRIGNHAQGFALLNNEVKTLKAGVKTVTTVFEAGGGGGGGAVSPILSVNNQTGNASYTTAAGDNDALLVLSNGSAIAVTLAGSTPPYGLFITNIGTATATLTPAPPPTGTSTISYAGNAGASSMPLIAGASAIVAYDGTNWWAALMIPGVTSLNGLTGALSLVAGSNITITPAGSNITIASSGGGGGTIPFTVIQDGASTIATGTSWTYTYPQALQASGATVFAIICQGSDAAFTLPAGWTKDVDVASGALTTTNRLVVMHKTSDGTSSVTWTTSGAANTPTIRFFELSGTRLFDQSATGFNSADIVTIPYPSITPTAGAAVFAFMGSAWNGGFASPFFPLWQRSDGGRFALIWPWLDWLTPGVAANSRFLLGMYYPGSASGSAITPPAIENNSTMFPSTGVAYATFSIK